MLLGKSVILLNCTIVISRSLFLRLSLPARGQLLLLRASESVGREAQSNVMDGSGIEADVLRFPR